MVEMMYLDKEHRLFRIGRGTNKPTRRKKAPQACLGDSQSAAAQVAARVCVPAFHDARLGQPCDLVGPSSPEPNRPLHPRILLYRVHTGQL